MFLNATTPKRAFYNNAVRSYGFLDSFQNLHGLLELESESVKNWILAQIKNERQLMFRTKPFWWHEEDLGKLKEILNRSKKEFWERAGEDFIKELWEVANEAQSKSSPYDQTRKMLHNVDKVEELRSEWFPYKKQEEAIANATLRLSFEITKRDPANLKDTIRNIINLLDKLNNLKFNQRYESIEIKEIREILTKAWMDKYFSLKEQLRYEEKVTRLKERLKPPQEERLRELVSLKKIEQHLNGKTSIDPNTRQEIVELLNVEKSLPQADQNKKNFLEELEQKFLSPNGQTQPQTSETISRIRNRISEIFQNSIKDALEQGNSKNNSPQNNVLSKQLQEDIVGLAQRLASNGSTGLLPSDVLQNIVNSIDQDLVYKLKGLATAYNNRISDTNYQDLMKERTFSEFITLSNDRDRLQSVYGTHTKVVFIWPDLSPNNIFSNYENNFNVDRKINVNASDSKLPLTVKFKREVKEVIKLIFQKNGIDEREIAPFLNDLEKIIDVLGSPSETLQSSSGEELEYFRQIIEDFRDTKCDLDINIFKEFSSWKGIFANRNHLEDSILRGLDEVLTFENGIDSINFYAANEHVQRALLCTLPLRSEITNQQKRAANLPTSDNPAVIRQEMIKIFDYGLQEGINDPLALQNNKEIIRKRLELLHDAKLVNFPVTQSGSVDVFTSYSKVMEIVVSVEDKDYEVPLHRTTNYHCKIEYAENGKVDSNNTVQVVEEF
jgi:hypothetical protein